MGRLIRASSAAQQIALRVSLLLIPYGAEFLVFHGDVP